MPRIVEYFTMKLIDGTWTKVLDGIAEFHQFGCDCEEFKDGVGTFSTAIIELKSGTVKNIPVEMIKFIDR